MPQRRRRAGAARAGAARSGGNTDAVAVALEGDVAAILGDGGTSPKASSSSLMVLIISASLGGEATSPSWAALSASGAGSATEAADW